MQTIDKDKNIVISQGDVLNVPFRISGLTLSVEDRLYFTVKDRLSDEDVLINHKVNNIDVDNNRFAVVIPSSVMNTLKVGSYFYDIVWINAEGNQRTLNYPAKLIIKEVAHNDNFND